MSPQDRAARDQEGFGSGDFGERQAVEASSTSLFIHGIRPGVKSDWRGRLFSQRLRKVEEYVRENLADPAVRLTLAALATAAQLSPYHLHRL